MRALPAVLVVSCLLMASGCNCDGGGGQDGGSGGGAAGGGGGGAAGGGSTTGGGGGGGGSATGGGAGEVGDGGLVFRLGAVQAVVADSSGTLWLVGPDGVPTLLVDTSALQGRDFPGNPRWSPDGKRVAFTNRTTAFVAELDGGYRQVATDTGGTFREGSTYRVEWSGDGTRLVLDGVDNASDAPAAFLAVPDGGEPVYLGWADAWSFAPDRRDLLTSFNAGTGEDVYRWNLGALDAGLERPGYLLDASPRGAVAVREERQVGEATGPALVVVLPDGGSTLLFDPGTAEVSQLAFRPSLQLSPYADEAAGVVIDQSERYHFVRVRFDGGVVDYLQATFVGDMPTCFRFVPGGVFLSFVAPGDPSVLLLGSPDGGTEPWAPTLDMTAELACLDWRVRP